MKHDIKGHFTKTVGDYDTVSDSVVINNNQMHQSLVNGLPFGTDFPLNILDLGSGTGHGMQMILEKFPQAHVSGVDFSPRMMDLARKHLEPFVGRYSLFTQDFRDVPFRENTFDAIVSAVSIHNITHSEKKELFAKMFMSLKPGGVFINADFVLGESEEEIQRQQNTYRKYLNEHLEGQELEVWLHHAFEEDMPMRLSDQEFYLQKVGFQRPEVLWSVNNQVVYRCTK